MCILIALTLWLLPMLTDGTALLAAQAPHARTLPPDTSCTQLAQADPSATNGTLWGTTILPGLGQPSGWFGVPVCANGVNQAAPGGANVSCDRMPLRSSADGDCAPGSATSDGYGLTFQCVELVARFAVWAFGDAPGGWRGDAPYLWLSGHHPADFSASPNGDTQAPKPGDILVWGSLDTQGRPWPAGPAGGHVAVVAAVGGGHISFVEENMLGHRGAEAINIPRERTTLTESATGAWTVGSTYGANGGRALYGWLHSTRNTGHFPSSKGAASTAPSAPDDRSSLAGGVVVTGKGALAQLVWSDTHTPSPASNPSNPSNPSSSASAAPTAVSAPAAVVESLGAPPGVALAPDQAPAVVALPDGERYVFARGQDGTLYSAYTTPRQPGVAWQALGAPPGVSLTSAVTALWTRDEGMVVGALGSDGAFWLCSGPAGVVGVWWSLGRPAQVAGFQGTPILVSTPSSTASTARAGSPRALAIGTDGRLYDSIWSAISAANASSSVSSSVSNSASGPLAPGWSAWAPIPLPANASSLTGALVAATAEPTHSSGASGEAGVLDLLAPDAAGHVWFLQGGALGQTWSVAPLSMPTATSVLLAAILQATTAPSTSAGAPTATLLHVYAADRQVGVTTASPTPGAGAMGSLGPAPMATPTATPTNAPTASGASGPPSPSISQATHPAPMPHLAVERISEGTFTLDAPTNGEHSAHAVTPQAWASLGTVTAPTVAAPASGASTGSESQLVGTEQSLQSLGSPIALDLGAQGSALLVTEGDAVSILGAAAAIHLLIPKANKTTTPSQTGPLVIGMAPGPDAFSDQFSGDTLDPRWLATDAPAVSPSASLASQTAHVANGTLTLTPPSAAVASGGMESLMVTQGAPTGDFTVTVHMTLALPPETPETTTGAGTTTASAPGTSHSVIAQSGLALQLDEWHRVTLALRGGRGMLTVALCATSTEPTPWCSAMPLPAPSSSAWSSAQGGYLRVSQTGSMLTGSVSADGTHWTTVGSWAIVWLPTSAAQLGAYAPPIAPPSTASAAPGERNATSGPTVWRSFTSVGLFVATQSTAVTTGASQTPTAPAGGQVRVQFSDYTIG